MKFIQILLLAPLIKSVRRFFLFVRPPAISWAPKFGQPCAPLPQAVWSRAGLLIETIKIHVRQFWGPTGEWPVLIWLLRQGLSWTKKKVNVIEW